MKKISMIFALIFGCILMADAQNEQARVQNSEGAGSGSYSTFYWIDNAQESLQGQAGQSMQSGQQGMQTDQGMQTEKWNKDKDKMKTKKHMQSSMGMAGEDHRAVKSAILHEMISRGYELDQNNPDLLVGYQIFEEKGEVQGFSDNEDAMGAATGITGAGQQQTHEVDAGTLMITISDSESGEMISRGFLSGALGDNMAKGSTETQPQGMERPDQPGMSMEDDMTSSHVQAIKAVTSIFDQFQITETATIGGGAR